jgi:hypothetical protein
LVIEPSRRGDLSFFLGEEKGERTSSITSSLVLTMESISTNWFSKMSIIAYPNPGITLELLGLLMVSFLPVVTEIAREAASLSFFRVFWGEEVPPQPSGISTGMGSYLDCPFFLEG